MDFPHKKIPKESYVSKLQSSYTKIENAKLLFMLKLNAPYCAYVDLLFLLSHPYRKMDIIDKFLVHINAQGQFSWLNLSVRQNDNQPTIEDIIKPLVACSIAPLH
jgi:hypothetical protein